VAGQISISEDSPRPIVHVFSDDGSMKWKISDGQVLDVSAKLAVDDIEVIYWRWI
jgi:hypothetical protein